ncbi:MAG: superfamily protein [Crocinitomicaceae bacterium]|jgi:UDP-N-acetylenolpyruvoylglucosamine reductase|nr:superfamily protein [Crocinitomicaceae bacterium]
MEGLQSFEHLSGTPGEVGSKARMQFQMGKRNIEMIETVTVRNLPHEFSGTYDAKGVHNIVKNYFKAIDDKTTLYTTDQEFQFKGFMKLIGALMPGAFKKQSMKYLHDFKNFAEKN